MIALLLVAPPPATARAASQAAPPPEISAAAAILVDLTAERIIAEQAAHERRAIASLTKVMTAVVALRYGKLSDEVTIEGRDLPGQASVGLKPGDRFSLETLLYGMLMRSGNDAAAAVARAVGEKVATERGLTIDGAALFITMMNQEAVSLGMVNTRFINPHGLDATNQYSTAYDLALLTRHALRDTTFAQMFQARSYPFRAGTWTNVNRLLDQYDGLVGGKTGIENQSGLCLIEVAQRDNQRLVVVVLNAPQWYADARAWLDFGFGAGRRLASASLPPFGQPAPLTGIPLLLGTPLVVGTPSALTSRATPAAPTAAPVAAGEASRGAGDSESAPDPVPLPTPADGAEAFPLMVVVVSALALVVLVALVGLTLRTMGVGPWRRRAQAVRRRPEPDGPWRTFHIGQTPNRGAHRPSPAEEEALQDIDDPPTSSLEESPRSTTGVPQSRTDELALAHVAVAVRYVSEGRLESAVSAFIKVIQVAPEFRFTTVPTLWTMGPEGFLTLATAYIRCNRLADARAVVTLGLITFGDDPDLRGLDTRLQSERRRSSGGGGSGGPRARGHG